MPKKYRNTFVSLLQFYLNSLCINFLKVILIIVVMGHNKKQQQKLAAMDAPSGKGRCPSCGKTVQNLGAHVQADHKGEKVTSF